MEKANDETDLALSEVRKKLSSSLFTDTAVLVAITTGVLYLGGLMQQYGYMNVWGIESPLFPLNVNDYFVHGFFALLAYLGSKYFFFTILGLIVYSAVLVLLKKYLPSFGDNAFNLVILLGAVLLFLVFFISSSYEKGQAYAENIRGDFDCDITTKKHKFYKEYRLTGEDGLVSEVNGYLVAVNTQFLAIYSGKEITVVPLSRLLSIKSMNLTPLRIDGEK